MKKSSKFILAITSLSGYLLFLSPSASAYTGKKQIIEAENAIAVGGASSSV